MEIIEKKGEVLVNNKKVGRLKRSKRGYYYIIPEVGSPKSDMLTSVICEILKDFFTYGKTRYRNKLRILDAVDERFREVYDFLDGKNITYEKNYNP